MLHRSTLLTMGMGGLRRSVARVAVGQLQTLRMRQLRKPPCAYRSRHFPLIWLFLCHNVVCFLAITFLHSRYQTYRRLHIFVGARLVCDRAVNSGQGVSNIVFRGHILWVLCIKCDVASDWKPRTPWCEPPVDQWRFCMCCPPSGSYMHVDIH